MPNLLLYNFFLQPNGSSKVQNNWLSAIRKFRVDKLMNQNV